MEQDNSFVLTMPLKTEPWQSNIIDRRMEYLRLLYNYVQGKLLRQYKYFSQLDEYKAIKTYKERTDFFRVHTFTIPGVLDRDKKPLNISFTEYGITNFVEKLNQKTTGDKTYKELGINTSYLDALAVNIWTSWNYFLYYKGKAVHFRSKGELNTLVVRMKKSHGKNDFAGLKLDIAKRTIGFKLNSAVGRKEKWMSLTFGTGAPTDYEKYAFALGFDSIRIITVIRKRREGKYKYYLQLTFRGRHSDKERSLGKGSVGIDISPSTIAVSSLNGLTIYKLADRADSLEHDIWLLKRKISRSRQANNPQNYNEDGTLKKGVRYVWHQSNRYKALVAELNELLRHQAAVKKRQHIEIANSLLKLGDTFIVESHANCSLAGRATNSVSSHSPYLFVSILKSKVLSLGGRFLEVNSENDASGFDFTDGSFHHHDQDCIDVTLSNGNTHRSDLLAAFNLQHMRPQSEELNSYDVEAMKEDYPIFCQFEGEEFDRNKKRRCEVR